MLFIVPTSLPFFIPLRDTPDRSGIAGQNPSLSLGFLRFSSDTQVEFQARLISIIRKRAPNAIITHNLMGAHTDVDYTRLSQDLDVVSWDNYPFFQTTLGEKPPAPFPHDLMRGLKRAPIWVMKQATGSGGWDRMMPTPEPGRMRLWAYQSIARGADYVSFFRWRSARYGTEQYWQGILDHHAQPGRRHQEVSALGRELARLSPEIAGTHVQASVAILIDWDCEWAFQIQPHTAAGVSHLAVAAPVDRAISSLGTTCDAVNVGTSLAGYNLVIAPSPYVLDERVAEALRQYVQSGGTLNVLPRTAVKDRENASDCRRS